MNANKKIITQGTKKIIPIKKPSKIVSNEKALKSARIGIKKELSTKNLNKDEESHIKFNKDRLKYLLPPKTSRLPKRRISYDPSKIKKVNTFEKKKKLTLDEKISQIENKIDKNTESINKNTESINKNTASINKNFAEIKEILSYGIELLLSFLDKDKDFENKKSIFLERIQASRERNKQENKESEISFHIENNNGNNNALNEIANVSSDNSKHSNNKDKKSQKESKKSSSSSNSKKERVEMISSGSIYSKNETIKMKKYEKK